MEIITLSKGSYYIFLNQIYILEKIVGKSCYFRCYEKYCTGRVKELNDFITVTKVHKCESIDGKIESMRLLKKFETMCGEDELSCDSLIEQMYFKASKEAKLYLPKRNALIQRFKRMKGKNMPQEGDNSNNLVNIINNNSKDLSLEGNTHNYNDNIKEEYFSESDNDFLGSIEDVFSFQTSANEESKHISPLFQLKSAECQIEEVNIRIRSLRKELSEAIKLKRHLVAASQ